MAGCKQYQNDTNEANYGWLRVKDMIIDQNGLLWITNSLVEKGLAHMNVMEIGSHTTFQVIILKTVI